MTLGRALAIAVLAMSAGCSDDEALSRAEYVERLNAMCEDFAAREEQIGEPDSVSDLVEKGPRILEAFEAAIVDEVSSLEAPDEIAEQADRLAEIANEQRDVLQGLVDAASDGDLAAVRTLAARNRALNHASNEIASELGASGCSTPGP